MPCSSCFQCSLSATILPIRNCGPIDRALWHSGPSLTSIIDLRIWRHLMIYEATLRYPFRGCPSLRGKEKFVRPTLGGAGSLGDIRRRPHKTSASECCWGLSRRYHAKIVRHYHAS